MNDRDERLAALLNRLDEDRRAGRVADVETMAREQPDLSDELRQLWAMAQVAQIAARPPRQTETITKPRVNTPSSGTLPRPFGEYDLLLELGRGGMGIVYKARHRELGRIVALKMLLHGDVATATDRARIRSEAKSAALLQHPNIVPVYEVGEADGRDFFTMPLIEGHSLSHVLADGPLPPREAAHLVAVLARAVHYAHEQGVIHRDLKPGNILLQIAPGLPGETSVIPPASRGLTEARIADFGLAKRLDPGRENLTQTGIIVGTPSFMPPEQAASNRGLIGPASDVYSLGAILYNCLTGRPPFQAAERYDILYMVLEQDPVPPRLLSPRVGRDLEIICLKCLQKSPEMRYATAADLAHDLERYLAGESLSIRPGELRDFFGRLFRPTHHINVLENWGGLWIAHSFFTLFLCSLTWLTQQLGETRRWPYMAMWGLGVTTWAMIFWRIRRRIGPVTFVERQIAHVWASGVAGSFGLLCLEWMLGRPVLEFAPMLALMAGMIFLCKAGILSGLFYLATGALFFAAAVMVWLPAWGMLFYGFTIGLCYFVPGAYFYWRRERQLRIVA